MPMTADMAARIVAGGSREPECPGARSYRCGRSAAIPMAIEDFLTGN